MGVESKRTVLQTGKANVTSPCPKISLKNNFQDPQHWFKGV